MPDIILRQGGSGADILLYEGVADAVTPLSIYLFQGAVTANDIILRPAINDALAAITGTLAVTEDADAAAFVGNVLSAISGALAVTEDSDTAAFVGTVGVQASMSAAVTMARVARRRMPQQLRGGPRSARGFY